MNALLGILGIFVVILICLAFMVGAICSIEIWRKRMEVMVGKDAPQARKTLTPTQKFILAASSPVIGNNYKCVIDIWDTHLSDEEVDKVIQLFEWGWGEFTYENAKSMADDCLSRGHNIKYIEYCSAGGAPDSLPSQYTDLQLQLLQEMKQRYPKQGMLAWDLVRTLSLVGGACMGGIMTYEEAVTIAFHVCKRLQENFSSWDDMVGSYTLGYQFWRGERATDRLNYYKKLKKTWIYKIPWNTELRENELGIF